MIRLILFLSLFLSCTFSFAKETSLILLSHQANEAGENVSPDQLKTYAKKTFQKLYTQQNKDWNIEVFGWYRANQVHYDDNIQLALTQLKNDQLAYQALNQHYINNHQNKWSSAALHQQTLASGFQYIDFASHPNNNPFLITTQGLTSKIGDIPYGNHYLQTFDLYVPDSDPNEKIAGLFIIIHGGAWTGGDKNYHFNLEYNLTQSLVLGDYIPGKYWVANLNYRLYPDTGIDGQIADIQTAIKKIFSELNDASISMPSIYLAGHSAGGYFSSLFVSNPTLLENNYPLITGAHLFAPGNSIFRYLQFENYEILTDTQGRETLLWERANHIFARSSIQDYSSIYHSQSIDSNKLLTIYQANADRIVLPSYTDDYVNCLEKNLLNPNYYIYNDGSTHQLESLQRDLFGTTRFALNNAYLNNNYYPSQHYQMQKKLIDLGQQIDQDIANLLASSPSDQILITTAIEAILEKKQAADPTLDITQYRQITLVNYNDYAPMSNNQIRQRVLLTVNDISFEVELLHIQLNPKEMNLEQIIPDMMNCQIIL